MFRLSQRRTSAQQLQTGPTIGDTQPKVSLGICCKIFRLKEGASLFLPMIPTLRSRCSLIGFRTRAVAAWICFSCSKASNYWTLPSPETGRCVSVHVWGVEEKKKNCVCELGRSLNGKKWRGEGRAGGGGLQRGLTSL